MIIVRDGAQAAEFSHFLMQTDFGLTHGPNTAIACQLVGKFGHQLEAIQAFTARHRSIIIIGEEDALGK